MQTYTFEGFSGHSSRKELMAYVYKASPKPKRVIVNHGENSRCLDLASSIHKVNLYDIALQMASSGFDYFGGGYSAGNFPENQANFRNDIDKLRNNMLVKAILAFWLCCRIGKGNRNFFLI